MTRATLLALKKVSDCDVCPALILTDTELCNENHAVNKQNINCLFATIVPSKISPNVKLDPEADLPILPHESFKNSSSD